MGKVIESISIAQNGKAILSNCVLIYNKEDLVTDEHEVPYDYTVLMHRSKTTGELHAVEILDMQELVQVVGEENCVVNDF